MPSQQSLALVLPALLSFLVALGLSAAVPPERLAERDAVPSGYVAAPFYPAPNGGWEATWKTSYTKAQALVSKMTLAEKTNITSGTGIYMGRCVGNTGSASYVGFPQLCLQDGPLGIRATDHNTAFPAGITTGATFDKDLMYQRGVALGQEFRGKGVNIYLGPSVGALGRKPRGGRGWEGFGTDPVLQAVAGAQTIKGVQEQGVIATIKHLIANEQEMYRMYNVFMPGISSNVDDRTLHELYLWPFAEGVRAGVGAVMTAYNAVNGSACSQNAYLINGLLKNELGFQGLVMSDWLAQISGVGSALAGLDMNMPGDGSIPLAETSYWMYDLTRAVLNGSVPLERLNDMATRIVATWYQLGQDQDYPEPNFSAYSSDAEGYLYYGSGSGPQGVINEYVNVQSDHYKVARQISQDAITLLKNVNNTLPLKTTTPLKVFGDDAQANTDGINSCSDKGCNKGTLGMGWGSGSANYPYMDAPIDAIKNRSTTVTYFSSNSFPSNSNPQSTDVAIVFINSDSGENYITVEGNDGDRNSAGLYAWHSGDDLVKKAAAAYSTVVVVVHTVGAILVENWIDLPTVKAVVFAHLPGQEAGSSLANVLYGDVSPSGKLPYSVPKAESDFPSSLSLTGFAIGQPQDTFSEGLYIDYRYLNKNNIVPRFPFGYGLSYTNFTFSSPKITRVNTLSSATPAAPGTKGSTPTYSTNIPAASEAYYPDGFQDVWRYLYSWLSKSDADAAAASATATSKYPYPTGYSSTQKTSFPAAGGASGGNPDLWTVAYTVSVTVTNSGSKAGKAVLQAYLQYPSSSSTPSFAYDTPTIQLRDFGKTATLQPGQSQTLTFTLTRKDLSVWDVTLQNWVVSSGTTADYFIWVAESTAATQLANGYKCSTKSLTCVVGGTSPVS